MFCSDASCEEVVWYMDVDYATLQEEVGKVSEYYVCTPKRAKKDG